MRRWTSPCGGTVAPIQPDQPAQDPAGEHGGSGKDQRRRDHLPHTARQVCPPRMENGADQDRQSQ